MKKPTKKDYIYLSVIFVLCVVIAVLSVIAFYEKNAHKEYYDNKCASYAVQNTNLSKNQIVFIGDSITDLYPLDNYYADLNLAAYNRGIGGDTTSGVIKRLKVSVYDLAPSKVVLMISTNDINGGISVNKIMQNYREILSGIYEHLPSVELFVMSVIPQNEDLESYTTIRISQTTPKILEVNSKISALAAEYGATYLDLFSRLADENNHLIKDYSDDGIHLNANGFAVWTALLKPYLLGV